MQFNTSIPNHPLPDYREATALQSSRSSSLTPSLWKKNQQIGQQTKQLSEAVGRIYREVRKIRPRIKSTILGFPFRCYNVPAADCIQTDTTGPQDSWRTFQVAAGMVGARSVYGFPSGSFLGVGTGGNYEVQLIVTDGTDGFFDNGGEGIDGNQNGAENVDFQQENYSLNQLGGDAAPNVVVLTATPQAGVGPTQWLLANTPPTSGTPAEWLGAAFWVQITDTAANAGLLDVQVYGQMIGLSSDGFTQSFFPEGPNIIPIAAVVPAYVSTDPDNPNTYNPTTDIGKPFAVVQFAYDHVLNRFPSPYTAQTPASTGPFAGPNTYRGDWANDRLSGLFFYPGDIVTDSTQQVEVKFPVGGANSVFVNIRTYMCLQTTPQQLSTAPPGDSNNWLQIGGLQGPQA